MGAGRKQAAPCITEEGGAETCERIGYKFKAACWTKQPQTHAFQSGKECWSEACGRSFTQAGLKRRCRLKNSWRQALNVIVPVKGIISREESVTRGVHTKQKALIKGLHASLLKACVPHPSMNKRNAASLLKLEHHISCLCPPCPSTDEQKDCAAC